MSVRTVDELCSWLEGCEYVSDRERLGVDDHWCHPIDFERHRRGDCEDHALWAWRKLHELGTVATLVVGEARSHEHVWVTFVHEGALQLLESTRKGGRRLVELAEGVHDYWPAYGVDTRLRTYRYDAVRSAPGTRSEGGSHES